MLPEPLGLDPLRKEAVSAHRDGGKAKHARDSESQERQIAYA